MSTPIISIIIPVYNAEKTLQRCIDSILCQTFDDYEIILVEDGSSDSSFTICNALQESYQNIKATQIPHSGPSTARNKGIEMANGKYITFIDSDDEVDRKYLQTLLSLITSQDADVAALSYKIVAREETPKENVNRTPIHIKVFSREEAVLDLLYQNNLDSSQCFKLFKREIFKEIRFPGQYQVYEDLWVIYKIYSKCQKIVWSPQQLYYYHKTTQGQMDRICPQVDDALNVVKDIKADLLDNFHGEQFVKAIKNRTISISFNLLRLLSQQRLYNAELEAQCWNNIKALRLDNLLDTRVRAKNKVGVLTSYLGKNFFKMLCRQYSKF